MFPCPHCGQQININAPPTEVAWYKYDPGGSKVSLGCGSLILIALIVLIVLIAVVIAAWLMVAMMPGQIAKKRGHPQAEAINVMGWWGAITMGVLAPIAWVWAFTKPIAKPVDVTPLDSDSDTDSVSDGQEVSS